MAAHLSGVEGAVATCGTAFGADHIKVLRRIVRDEADQAPAKVVFTFDGDKAGQEAAMKAYAQDDKWASQSYVAVAKDGMDPCDLRLREGDLAVRELVADAVPMFEFAVRTTLGRFDLDTAEGRVRAMGAVAPIINSIRDSALRPEYVRTVAGWVGVEVEQMREAVTRAGRIQARDEAKGEHRTQVDAPEPTAAEAAGGVPAPDLRDPVVLTERQLLQSMLQHPSLFTSQDLDEVDPQGFSAPAHRAVFDAIRSVGPLVEGLTQTAWHARVDEATPWRRRRCSPSCRSHPCPSSTTPRPVCRRRTTPARSSCGSARWPCSIGSPRPPRACGSSTPTRSPTLTSAVSWDRRSTTCSGSGLPCVRRPSEPHVVPAPARTRGARPRRRRARSR